MEAYESISEDYPFLYKKLDLTKVDINKKEIILLLNCIEDKCQKVDGYVTIKDNKILRCTDGACLNEVIEKIEITKDCTENDGGKIHFNVNLQLCLPKKNPSFIDINEEDIYFVGATTSGPYKKYIGNLAKTAIGMPIPGK